MRVPAAIHHGAGLLRLGRRHPRAVIRIPAGLLQEVRRGGPLERPWLAAALAALFAASLGLLLASALRRRAAGRRPRHRALRRIGAGAWLVGLALVAASASLNAYVGYVPTLPALFGALPPGALRNATSLVEVLRMGDPRLGVRPGSVYVYLPPGYGAAANDARRYPVVYLLHGYPGGSFDWFRAAELRQTMDSLLLDHLVRPMILVAPDASGGWLHDSEMLNQVHGPQVETYLTSTVVHAVDSRFRTLAGRGARAIGGMSSGGYGALNLGLRHQELFSVILSEMPYGDPGQVTASLLGGSRRLWLQNAPSHYIPSVPFRYRMAVFLIAGTHDPQLGEARVLDRELTARGQLAVLEGVDGASHTWRGARLETPYALIFASEHLIEQRQTSAGPAARAPLGPGQPGHLHASA